MIWQFGELGYDFSINRCPNGSINQGCRTDPKPVRWDYFTNPDRRRLFNIYAAMNQLKTTEPAFGTANFTFALSGTFKQIRLIHPSMNVMVYGNWGSPMPVSPPLSHRLAVGMSTSRAIA